MSRNVAATRRAIDYQSGTTAEKQAINTQDAAGGQDWITDYNAATNPGGLTGGFGDTLVGGLTTAGNFVADHPEVVYNPIGAALDSYGIGPNAGLKAVTGGRVSIPGAEGGGPGLSNIIPALSGALGGGAGTGGIASPELAAAIANSRALQNQYNVPVTPHAAPTTSAALMGPVERAQQQAAIQAQQVQAAKIAAYQAAQEVGPIQAGVATAGQSTASQIGSTALAKEQAAIQAQQVQAALAQRQGNISADRVGAAQADRTVLGPTDLAGGTKLAPTSLSDQTVIDALKQNQFREGQTGLISGLNDAIAGKDPSVAAIMLRQATERNAANQYAMAQAASGQNAGIASYNAARNVADLNQQAAGQQALLRAQEIATARGQLGSVLSSGRESDIGLATSQAGLSQQVNLANAGFTNTANMSQAQLDQAIKLANSGFKNTATTTQAQLDQATSALNTTQQNQVATTNANNALDAAKTNVALAQQAALANQSAENTAKLQNAQNALAAATKNAELAQQVAISNQGALNNTSQVNAQLSNATGIANAGNVTQASTATAQNQTSAANTAASLNAAIRQTNATNQSNSSTNQAKLDQEASTTNATNSLTASKSNAELGQQVALANALAANKASETNANNQTGVNTANLNANVQTNAQNITDKQNAAANTLTASGQQVTAAAAKATADAAAAKAANDQANRNQDLLIKGIGAIASGGTSSDRQKKKSIRRADKDIVALLKGIKPYGFKYKDPKAPGAADGKRFGVMAQDLEKSKAGKTLVHDTPHGKMVDVNQAVLAALAGLGNVNKRLETVEKKRAA